MRASRSASSSDGLVGEHGDEPLVLFAEAVVEDGAFGAEPVGAGIDERRVFELLVGQAFDRIDVDQRRAQPRAGLGEHAAFMAEEFAQGDRIIVDQGVRVGGRVPDAALGEAGDEGAEEVRALAARATRRGRGRARAELAASRNASTSASVPFCET